jgi:hypothetical protein
MWGQIVPHKHVVTLEILLALNFNSVFDMPLLISRESKEQMRMSGKDID